MSKVVKSTGLNAPLSRRKFLSYAGSSSLVGLSSSPVVALFSTILGGQSQKAWADSLGIQPRAFVQILEGGGPARWMYDSFLTPYTSAGYINNPMAGTQFQNVGGRYIGVEYVTSQVRGIQVPTMWTHDLPTPGGGYAPMADLLDNILCIQGITTQNAGHDLSQVWHWLQPGAAQSISALTGDVSNAPFAALNVGADGYTFRSIASKSSLNVVPYNNVLRNLLDPFKKTGSSQFQVKRNSLKAAYDSILPSLDELARQGHPGAEALSLNRDSALQLMEINFANLDTEWTSLVNKYQSLVTRAIYDPSRPLVGINDRPIGEGGTGASPLYQLSSSDSLGLHLASDVRTAIDSRTTVNGLAQRFAFTEYILRNKLSSSVALGVEGISNFIRESDGAVVESMGNDQHFAGLYPTMYFNILRHRAVIACVRELREQLKAANLWSDTVISVSGEFNRNPQVTSLGSDHGFDGKSISLYSGAFTGPLIIGDLTSDPDPRYRGSWGQGGRSAQLGRQLNLVDQSVTMSHLLRVPPAFTSTLPLVNLGGGGLVSNIGTTKHV